MGDATEPVRVALWNRRTSSTSEASIACRWDQRMAVLSLTSASVDPMEAVGADMFEALQQLRLRLEPLDLYPLCNGARVDCYPSGMARDMGGGLRVYVLTIGQSERPPVVGTFDPADPGQVGTVAEQDAHYSRWLDDQRRRGSGDGA